MRANSHNSKEIPPSARLNGPQESLIQIAFKLKMLFYT